MLGVERSKISSPVTSRSNSMNENYNEDASKRALSQAGSVSPRQIPPGGSYSMESNTTTSAAPYSASMDMILAPSSETADRLVEISSTTSPRAYASGEQRPPQSPKSANDILNRTFSSQGSTFSADDSIIQRVEQEIAAARQAAASLQLSPNGSSSSPRQRQLHALLGSMTSHDHDMQDILNIASSQEQHRSKGATNSVNSSFDDVLHLIDNEFVEDADEAEAFRVDSLAHMDPELESRSNLEEPWHNNGDAAVDRKASEQEDARNGDSDQNIVNFFLGLAEQQQQQERSQTNSPSMLRSSESFPLDDEKKCSDEKAPAIEAAGEEVEVALEKLSIPTDDDDDDHEEESVASPASEPKAASSWEALPTAETSLKPTTDAIEVKSTMVVKETVEVKNSASSGGLAELDQTLEDLDSSHPPVVEAISSKPPLPGKSTRLQVDTGANGGKEVSAKGDTADTANGGKEEDATGDKQDTANDGNDSLPAASEVMDWDSLADNTLVTISNALSQESESIGAPESLAKPPRQSPTMRSTETKRLLERRNRNRLISSPRNNVVDPPAASPQPVAEDESLKSRNIRLRKPFPVLKPAPGPRDDDSISVAHSVGLPNIQIRWLKPKPELKRLIVAAMGTSLQRRSNACGALKVLTSKKKNQMTLVRTDSFLTALLYTATQDIVEQDHDLAVDARGRAVASLRNVCSAKENRVHIMMHPGVIECLLKVVKEDNGEARTSACAALALLSKSPECREGLVEYEELLDTLAWVLYGEEQAAAVTTKKEVANQNYVNGLMTPKHDSEKGGTEKTVESGDSASEVSGSSDESSDDEHDDETRSTVSPQYTKKKSKLRSRRHKDHAPDLQHVDSIKFRQEERLGEYQQLAQLNACACLVHLSRHCTISVRCLSCLSCGT